VNSFRFQNARCNNKSYDKLISSSTKEIEFFEIEFRREGVGSSSSWKTESTKIALSN
jgi:hypothetical protein